MSKIMWIDLETTGLNPERDEIIEIAVIYRDTDLEISEEFHRYIKLENYGSDFDRISKLTGITADHLESNGVTNGQAYNAFIEFLSSLIDKFDKKDKAIFAGYNAKFDNNFLRMFFIKNKNKYFGSYFHSVCLDVASNVAEAILHNGLSLQNNQLQTVANHYGIEFNAHSAISDIRATIKLYEKLKEELKNV